MRHIPVLAAGCLAALCAATPARADNFRCPNGAIVSTRDSISVVAAKCDPPDFVARRQEAETTIGNRVFYVDVEEWTYTTAGTLIKILTFRNGLLDTVQTGGFVR